MADEGKIEISPNPVERGGTLTVSVTGLTPPVTLTITGDESSDEPVHLTTDDTGVATWTVPDSGFDTFQVSEDAGGADPVAGVVQ